MAMTCCLCNKTQSGWITDYPLEDNLSEYRICVKCHDKVEKISKNNNNEDIFDEINFLKQIASKPHINSIVVEFINQLILAVENPTNEVEPTAIASDILINKVKSQLDSIKLTSGYNFEGYTIVEYCEFISTEVALGLGIFKSIATSLSDVFGIESYALKSKLIDAKQYVFQELKSQAIGLDANAIIGVDLDYTMFGNSIVAVILSGTAVKIKPLDLCK